ncbi:hypothetical protein B479_04635 [Pseudomonas putida HB3267]|nr:hypothetical protein B479_04635 [Pseudomonas putida HB3267]
MLSSDEAITEYLSQVLADGDTEEIIRALGHIARARGMTRIATESGLGRESLYKALSPGAKPRFDTVLKVHSCLGCRPPRSAPCGSPLAEQGFRRAERGGWSASWQVIPALATGRGRSGRGHCLQYSARP